MSALFFLDALHHVEINIFSHHHVSRLDVDHSISYLVILAIIQFEATSSLSLDTVHLSEVNLVFSQIFMTLPLLSESVVLLI